jgi:hypothetical protein
VRSHILALAIVLAAPTAVLAPAGAAAVETCQGRLATIVGTPGAHVAGTPGPDVVVTNGASVVETGAGDDVVCTTLTPQTLEGYGVEVDAGPGNDSLVTTDDGPDRMIGANLGEGDDVLRGGKADEVVDARDGGRDIVVTAGGNDAVWAGGAVGGGTGDMVVTGASADRVFIDGDIGPMALVSGGGGPDEVVVSGLTAGTWDFDNRLGVVRHDHATAWGWYGVERLDLTLMHDVGRISFIGGPDDELLEVRTSSFAGALLGGAMTRSS